MDNERTPGTRDEIVIKDLEKDFGDVKAVNGLNLEIRKGEMFGFLGPNGAGKTTTINMLCGLLKPTAGSAQIGGFDISKEPRKAKALIGVCPQEAAVFKFLTGMENLETLWKPSRPGQEGDKATGRRAGQPGGLCRGCPPQDQGLQRRDDATVEPDDRPGQRPGDRLSG